MTGLIDSVNHLTGFYLILTFTEKKKNLNNV